MTHINRHPRRQVTAGNVIELFPRGSVHVFHRVAARTDATLLAYASEVASAAPTPSAATIARLRDILRPHVTLATPAATRTEPGVQPVAA